MRTTRTGITEAVFAAILLVIIGFAFGYIVGVDQTAEHTRQELRRP